MRQPVKLFLFIAPLAAGAVILYPRPPASPLAQPSSPPPASITQRPKPSRGPASLTAPASPKNLARFREKLEQTAACFDRDCDFPRTDDHSYQYAVGQALKAQLTQLRSWAERSDIHDEAITDLAITYLKVGDGYVQEEALRVLAAQPPRADALDAVLNEVIGGYDSRLIAAGLAELQRYQAMNDRIRIGAALADSMVTGAPFVAKEVSAGVAPFVTDATLAAFREAAATIPAGSAVRANLDAALKAH